MEHLFKLKKNGKTVGYCKWTEDWGFKYSLTADFKEPFTHFAVAQTKSITVHPFVTKDKNGKDVFAGDTVKSGKRVLTIVWDKCNMQWKVKEQGRSTAAEYYLGDTPLCQWAISEQFELIEEKEDENHP